MPYNKKQMRLFEGCRNNPEKMQGECPDKKFLEKAHREQYHPETRAAHHAQKKRGSPKYH